MDSKTEIPSWLSAMLYRLRQSHLRIVVDDLNRLVLPEDMKEFIKTIMALSEEADTSFQNSPLLKDLMGLGVKQIEELNTVVEIVLAKDQQRPLNQNVKYQFNFMAGAVPDSASQDTLHTMFGLPSAFDHFTGRLEALTQMRAHIPSTPLSHHSTILVSGTGGIGKTQLVAAFAYAKLDEYKQTQAKAGFRTIIWLVAGADDTGDSQDIMIHQMHLLGERLGLDPKNLASDVFIKQIYQRLDQEHAPYLMVFDNAHNLNSIKKYLPGSRTPLIITTRNHNERDWSQSFKVISLSVFTEKEATDYCRKVITLNHDHLFDFDAVVKLSQSLGYFPLALTQALAYICTENITLLEYLEEFSQQKRQYLQLPVSAGDPYHDDKKPSKERNIAYTGSAVSSQEVTIWAVIQLSLAKITNNLALRILKTCSYLAPETPIDLKLLPHFATSALESREAVSALRCYCLLENVPPAGHVRMHQLVQEIIRMGNLNDDTLLGELLTLFEDRFKGNFLTLSQFTQDNSLIPHLKSVLDHSQPIKKRNLFKAQIDALEIKLGIFYTKLRDANALDILLRALVGLGIDIRRFQEYCHGEVSGLIPYNRYAKVFFNRGYLSNHSAWILDRLSDNELSAIIGADALSSRENLKPLGYVLEQLGLAKLGHYEDNHRGNWARTKSKEVPELIEVVRILKLALELNQRCHGNDSSIVAVTLSNIAKAVEGIGDIQAQMNLLLAAFHNKCNWHGIRHIREVLNPEYNESQTSLHSVMSLPNNHFFARREEQSKVSFSEELLIHARALYLKAMDTPGNHYEVAQVLRGFASNTLIAAHERKQLLVWARALYEHSEGTDSVSADQVNLELALLDRGRLEDSTDVLQSLNNVKSVYGSTHPYVINSEKALYNVPELAGRAALSHVVDPLIESLFDAKNNRHYRKKRADEIILLKGRDFFKEVILVYFQESGWHRRCCYELLADADIHPNFIQNAYVLLAEDIENQSLSADNRAYFVKKLFEEGLPQEYKLGVAKKLMADPIQSIRLLCAQFLTDQKVSTAVAWVIQAKLPKSCVDPSNITAAYQAITDQLFLLEGNTHDRKEMLQLLYDLDVDTQEKISVSKRCITDSSSSVRWCAAQFLEKRQVETLIPWQHQVWLRDLEDPDVSSYLKDQIVPNLIEKVDAKEVITVFVKVFASVSSKSRESMTAFLITHHVPSVIPWLHQAYLCDLEDPWLKDSDKVVVLQKAIEVHEPSIMAPLLEKLMDGFNGPCRKLGKSYLRVFRDKLALHSTDLANVNETTITAADKLAVHRYLVNRLKSGVLMDDERKKLSAQIDSLDFPLSVVSDYYKSELSSQRDLSKLVAVNFFVKNGDFQVLFDYIKRMCDTKLTTTDSARIFHIIDCALRANSSHLTIIRSLSSLLMQPRSIVDVKKLTSLLCETIITSRTLENTHLHDEALLLIFSFNTKLSNDQSLLELIATTLNDTEKDQLVTLINKHILAENSDLRVHAVRTLYTFVPLLDRMFAIAREVFVFSLELMFVTQADNFNRECKYTGLKWHTEHLIISLDEIVAILWKALLLPRVPAHYGIIGWLIRQGKVNEKLMAILQNDADNADPVIKCYANQKLLLLTETPTQAMEQLERVELPRSSKVSLQKFFVAKSFEKQLTTLLEQGFIFRLERHRGDNFKVTCLPNRTERLTLLNSLVELLKQNIDPPTNLAKYQFVITQDDDDIVLSIHAPSTLIDQMLWILKRRSKAFSTQHDASHAFFQWDDTLQAAESTSLSSTCGIQ